MRASFIGSEATREPGDSHEGDGEVEPLPQASEGDEGAPGETARGHLAVGLLVLPRRTLAHESAGEAIHALAAVLAHAGHAPAGRRVDLAVLTCRRGGRDGDYGKPQLVPGLDLRRRPLDIASALSYLPGKVMATAQFITLSLLRGGVLIHRRLKYSFAGSISRSESRCFTKMPLIIGHADVRRCQAYVLRPRIKHRLENKNSSNKGQRPVYWWFLGASYKLVQQFGHIWSEEEGEGTKNSVIQGVEAGGNQRKVRFYSSFFFFKDSATEHVYTVRVAVNTVSGN